MSQFKTYIKFAIHRLRKAVAALVVGTGLILLYGMIVPVFGIKTDFIMMPMFVIPAVLLITYGILSVTYWAIKLFILSRKSK